MQRETIDFRFRPIGAQSVTPDTTENYLRKMKLDAAPSFRMQSSEQMLREMDAAGIALGVIAVPGPTSTKVGFESTTNEAIADLIAGMPEKFVGFGSIDTDRLDSIDQQLDHIDSLGLVGVTVEPTIAAQPRRLDSLELYPLYEAALRRHMPVVTTMSALLGPYMEDCHPEHIDHVATDFPGLKIVVQHGAWPYVREILGVAYRCENVYIVPGQYIHYGFPGWSDYVLAANRQLGEQILFGSVYPNCGPLDELMSSVEELGFDDETLPKYMRENAKNVLSWAAQ